MVQVNSHGGGCCGARHLRGFGEAENNNPNLINTALSTVPDSRMTEVILNGTQVRSYPNILRRLAHLGFVLDGHWINGNHNSHNYRFSRCDDRQTLTLAGWDGMVMSPGLHGTLPRVPGVNTERDDHVPYEHPLPAFQITDTVNRHQYLGQLHAFRRGGGIHPGIRYRINSPRSRYHNMELIALGRGNGGWNRNATIAFRDPVTRARFEISAANCVLAVNPRDEPRPPAGANMREFAVGDRIQVTNTWGNYRRGLVGTVIGGQGPLNVRIQFDTPGTNPTNSATNYVTIVDFDRQPDVPRTREAAIEQVRRQRLREQGAPRPELPPQRHLDDGEAAVPAPVVPPPVARIVLTTYHCVFRDGRRGAGYDTYDEAWENRGRRTRVDRRQIMSNGDIIWNENIHED